MGDDAPLSSGKAAESAGRRTSGRRSGQHTADAARADSSATDAAVSIFQRYPVASFMFAALLWSLSWWSAVDRLFPPGEDGVRPPQTARIASMLASAGSLGPTLAGLMCTLLVSGENGVQTLARRVFRPLSPTSMAITLLPWLAHGAAFALFMWTELGVHDVSRMFGREQRLRVSRGWGLALATAISEEFGWRGFLLPRLLRTMPCHRAALLSGFLWAVWHAVPTLLGLGDLGPRYDNGGVFPVASLALVPWALAHTAVYMLSEGSLGASLALATMTSWSSIVFEGALFHDNVGVQLYYGFVVTIAANVVILPVYVWLQRVGTQQERAGSLRDPAEAEARTRADAPEHSQAQDMSADRVRAVAAEARRRHRATPS